MSCFFTPDKESLSRTISENKKSDWVCILCNNLNFSFRKKCNRCKAQTRKQNENQIACTYSHYYCHESIQQTNGDSMHKSPLSDATNLQTPQKISAPNSPKGMQSNTILLRLAKHYSRKEPQTTLEKQLSNNKKSNFINEFWDSVSVRDFEGDDEERERENKDSFDESQVELLIGNILLEE